MKSCARWILFASFALFTGCIGSFSGEVYSDLNGNGLKDVNEPSAGSVPITITKDGQSVAIGYTAPDGTFSVHSEGKRVYCVSVDAAALSALEAGGIAPSKQLILAEAEKPIEKPAEKPQAPAPAPEPQLAPNCAMGKWGGTVHIRLPVKKEFMDVLEGISTPPAVVLRPGDVERVNIAFPKECSILPFFLPQHLVEALPSADVRFDEIMGRVEFVEGGGALSSSSEDFRVTQIDLRAHETIDVQTYDTTISPKAFCPDGKRYDLAPINIKVIAELDLDVTQTVVQLGAPVPGTQIPVAVTIVNRNQVKTEGCRLTLDFPETVSVIATEPKDACDLRAIPFECACDFKGGDREKIMTIRYQLPDAKELKGSTDLKFSARVKADDAEEVKHDFTIKLSP